MVVPPATWRDAEWVLARPLRQPRTGEHQRPSTPARTEPFLAPNDLSPLVGVQLVRPRRCAAAGAPAGPLQRGNKTPAATRKIPKNSQASPTTATHVTGSNRYALLTTATELATACSSAAKAARRSASARNQAAVWLAEACTGRRGQVGPDPEGRKLPSANRAAEAHPERVCGPVGPEGGHRAACVLGREES